MSVAYSIARSAMTKVYNTFVKTPPVLDRQLYFPQAQQFIDKWQDIRAEAIGLTGDLKGIPQFHELMPEQYKLSAHGNKEWRMFVVRAYGLDIEENMKRCPVLASLVRANPNVKSASLSYLAPGKQVPTHRGPFRGITRFSPGIKVPLAEDGKPGVILTVDGKD